ncbi:isochorismatase family protein [Streptomyces albus subsp. chlorinus]|uniref:isochorismatase family protein n=1 Tax=Streptomyces albus TaxID=1888 RepID=UPI00156EE252|nr:isochorismatase family protein [Streptomyces albus]NSC20206.1 isochorismatase family protein [Streptomyces albus subsp. chlorinus]
MALPAIEPYPLPAADELPANRADWRVDPSRAVLLVHDLQQHFLSAFPAGRQPLIGMLGNTARLLEVCRRLGVPVVYSAQRGGQTPRERGLQADFWGPGVKDDPDALAVPESVAPAAGDRVLTKWKYSAFVRTPLARLLRERGRDHLVIAGVYAHIGVQVTACDAWMRDIRAFVAADAVADFSRADHDAALRWTAGRCAVVATTDALVTQLTDARVGSGTRAGTGPHGTPPDTDRTEV